MNKNNSFYMRYIKRIVDIICGVSAVLFFWWLYVLIALLVKIKLGSPVLYTAIRTGKIDPKTGQEKLFKLYKFRSMSNATDDKGELLPDIERLTRFGRILRATSLDELPEVYNIIKGDMSVVGPRPLPEIYLPFYTEEERKRHLVRPGLSGYAQVNGRNAISWEEKFKLDVEYVNKSSFFLDLMIVIKTIMIVIRHEGIGQGEEAPGSLHIIRAHGDDNKK